IQKFRIFLLFILLQTQFKILSKEQPIAWQTSVKDAIPTIKKEMPTRYKQDSDIKLYVDNPKGPAKAL
ncbi:hypothetical protein RhiirC2_748297, partial [Rhizophagus irregularis]